MGDGGVWFSFWCFFYTLESTPSDAATIHFQAVAYALVSAEGGWKILMAIKYDIKIYSTITVKFF